jgi:hypothetical protein
MNHIHSRTIIDGSAPTFGMSQQTTANMFGQGYAHTAPSFSMPNPGLTPYTPGYNGRAYTNPNGDYQAPYTIVVHTAPIPLPGCSVGFLLNIACHNAMRHNTLDQSEFYSFDYETSTQFPFRPQPIDMMSTRATTEPGANPNNVTNQLALFWENPST